LPDRARKQSRIRRSQKSYSQFHQDFTSNFFGKTFQTQAFDIKKSACKILVKLTPVVNLSNILQVTFVLIFFRKKISKPNYIIGKKLCKTLLYEKVTRKILVKSTPRVNYTKILHATFGQADPKSVKRD